MSKNKGFSETSAGRYSLALYELAKESNDLDEVEKHSFSIIKLISSSAEFNSLIKDPTNQKEDQLLTRAKEFISINKCELEDRNLEIIFYEKFKNKKFTTPKFLENKYGIWLIGYDGNIKDYSSDDKIFFRLFNLIDSMPMRKSEIEKDTC